MLLGLCLGWYGLRRSSILQQPARDRVATAAKPVTASQLWCAVPIKQRKTKLISTAHIIWSLGHHQNLKHCWHHGTRHTSKFHNQPFIMRRAIRRHVFGHTDSLTHTHTRTHACTHTHTIKPPTAGV